MKTRSNERMVYFNGKFIPESEAKISIYDSSLMFGDMVFEMTRSFNKKHPYPYDKVKTVCVATHDERIFLGSLSMGQGPILLKPTIEYVKLRYEKECDGCICAEDAVLPGTMKVELSDMDHFGPAYRSFPASDPYDPARLCLSLTAVALEKGA